MHGVGVGGVILALSLYIRRSGLDVLLDFLYHPSKKPIW